jgi:RNA polymerase sigma-70 factor (ECF subfamily)
MAAIGDDALLAAFASGDRHAATVFVRHFQQRVFGVARMVTNDAALAEEVAQEAFLRAWRAAASFDARRGSVTAWLLTITRNLAIDAVRSRQARPADAATAFAMSMLADSDPADVATSRTDALRAGHALRQLPAEQARAVFQAVVLGRTAREVAEAENIPLGTAKTRIRSALIGLRERLAAASGEVARDL